MPDSASSSKNPPVSSEPVPDGADGESRSTRTYILGGGHGNFAESMIPLHGYLNLEDLRSTNELWNAGVAHRKDDPKGIYCGPGVRRDLETGRIHIRLAHTRLEGLGSNSYHGETDPRTVPLVIAGHDHALRIEGARHLRICDLVIRGAARSAVDIAEDSEDTAEDAADIEFDGQTIYAANCALRTHRTRKLRVVNCVFRGNAAPWHSRAHQKYRAGAGYLVVAVGKDFEFAHCAFTDHHDAVQIHGVDEMRFHHNLLDNFNDDGIEVGPKKESGRTLVYQNLITRCLTPFILHGSPGEKPKPMVSEPGSGVYIFRNVLDLRQGTYKFPPQKPDPSGAFLDHRVESVAHDHASPLWPNYYVYQNTFLLQSADRRGYYGFRWGASTRMTTRRVFNNAFVQVEGLPVFKFFPPVEDDFQANGNLFWAVREGPAFRGDIFEKFRRSPALASSREHYPPGWFAHDRFADPNFVSPGTDGKGPIDLRLQKDSSAVDAGVAIPEEWPDPLRDRDADKPDIGAFPLGVELWSVGPVAQKQK